MPFNVVSTTWPLFLGMGVLMLGAGLQSTLLGLRATLEGFPTVVTGVIMSCYYVGYLFGTLIAPRLLRQVPRLGEIALQLGQRRRAVHPRDIIVARRDLSGHGRLA